MFDEMSPDAVYRTLQETENCLLVDCRTRAEWVYVGIPDVSQTKARLALVEWVDGNGQKNPDFLAQITEQADKNAPVFVICRSGARSAAACMALIEDGFSNVCNVGQGFEGDLDANSHRGQINGWRYHQLPWQQR